MILTWKVRNVEKWMFFIGDCPYRFPIGKSKVVIELPTILFGLKSWWFYTTITHGPPTERDFSPFGDGCSSSCSYCSCYSKCWYFLGGLNYFMTPITICSTGCFKTQPKSQMYWSSGHYFTHYSESRSFISPCPSIRAWYPSPGDTDGLETLGLVSQIEGS